MGLNATAAANAIPQGFTTDVVPPRQRVSYWNDVSNNLFGSVKIATRSSDPFEAKLTRHPLGDLEIFSVRTSPMSLQRGPHAPTPYPSENLYAIDVICSGHGRVNISGKTMEVGPGNMLLMESSASNFFCFDVPTHILVLLLPKSRFGLNRQHLTPHLNQCLLPEQGGIRMLSRFMRDSWSDIEPELNGPRSSLMGDVMWNMLDLAFPIRGNVDNTQGSLKKSRLDQAQRIIERELANPEFSITDVSEALQVTPRYVQMLFNELNTTPTHYVLARRLDRAALQLRNDPDCRITDLALEVGFNDVTYFSRAFHKRFKMTAREYRSRYASEVA